MTPPTDTPTPPTNPVMRRLLGLLFDPSGESHTYAVLDGASIPDLIDALYSDNPPEFVCLYRGNLAPDLAEVAPYLVKLTPGSPFTRWLLSKGWGKHWGIFAKSTEDLTSLRRHFRRFLMVQSPEGKRLYFRFYDPRVLRIYLPTCNAEEMNYVCGPLHAYCCEDQDPTALLEFRPGKGAIERSRIPLD